MVNIERGLLMQCKGCGTLATEDANFCKICGTSLSEQPQIAVVSGREQRILLSSSSSMPVTPPLHEKLSSTTVEERLAQQQQMIADLQQELSKQFTQSYTEFSKNREDFEGRLQQLEVRLPPKIVPHSFSRRLTIILCSASIGFLLFFIVLFIHYFKHTIEDAAIESSILTILGSLYLAYDLLGRENGPLSWLTLVVTYGLAGAVMVEFPVLLIVPFDANLALEILLLSVLLGIFSGLLIGIPHSVPKGRPFEWKGAFIGAISGWLFWVLLFQILVMDATTHQRFIDFAGTVIIAIPLGIFVGGILGGFRHHFAVQAIPTHVDTGVSKPHLFSTRGGMIGFLVGATTLATLLGVAAYQGSNENNVIGAIGAVIGILLGFVTALTGSLAKSIFRLANGLPDKALAAIGLVLILLGAILQLLDPITKISGHPLP